MVKKKLRRKQVARVIWRIYHRAWWGWRLAAEVTIGHARSTKLGHEVKLISPQFVKPYVKGNKNDYNDAEGICEAVGRPTMRFVSVKTIEQQDVQALHRMRQSVVKTPYGAGQSDPRAAG